MKSSHEYAFSRWETLFLLVSVVAVTSVLSIVLDRRRRNPARLPPPPGPPKAPVFGNMFQLANLEALWVAHAEWAKEYGDIFSLQVPGTSMIVLNSIPVINELVEKRSAKYSDRLQLPAVAIAEADWVFGVMPYGSSWREHRRTFHQLMNENAIPQYRPIIQHHTTSFLCGLLTDPDGFFHSTQLLFGEIIMHLAYGTEDKAYIKDLIKVAEAHVQGTMIALAPGRLLVNTLPILRFVPTWFPGAGWKRDLRYLATLTEQMTVKTFEDAKQRIKDGTQGRYPSLVTQLLDRLPDNDGAESLMQEHISKNVIAVAYAAGAETTIASAWSLILALAKYPEVQKKVHAEIDAVVGVGRVPDFDDYHRLPYLQAVVKEVTRFWPVAPMGIPHATSEDDVYNGYFIEKGTVVIMNTWGIFRDPEHYPDPFEFRPERFLKDGQIDPNVLDPESCVFGYGRRICPGRHLSRESLSYMITSLLASFDIMPAKDANGNPLPLEYKPNGDMIIKPARFECRIVPRSPSHAALISEA